MDTKRPASLRVDAETVEALQRAADAMMLATESFRRQFGTQGGGTARPITYGGAATVVDDVRPRRVSRSRPVQEGPAIQGGHDLDKSQPPPGKARIAETRHGRRNTPAPDAFLRRDGRGVLTASAHNGCRHSSSHGEGRVRTSVIMEPAVPRQPAKSVRIRPPADQGEPQPPLAEPVPKPPVVATKPHRTSRIIVQKSRPSTHPRPGHRRSSYNHDDRPHLPSPPLVPPQPHTLHNVDDDDVDDDPFSSRETTPFPMVHHGIHLHDRSSDMDEASLIAADKLRRRRALARSTKTGSTATATAAAAAAAAADSNGGCRPPGFSPVQEILFVLVICISQMLMLSGLAQAMVPAQLIGLSFPDTSPGTVAWYSAAYSLTSATFVLPSGRLGDLFGHKKVFIVGFVWFGVWSFVAGFAPNVQNGGWKGTVFFCFCRAMQGVGPALLVPNGQALLGRTYPPGMRKNMVLCLFGASAPFGFVVGAIMASLLATKASWPWAFWILAIVCIFLAAASVFVLPATKTIGYCADESICEQLDVYGILLGVSGLVLFNFAFNQAPIVSWATPYTYFVLIIGGMLIGAFVWHEWLTAKHPLIPISAMKPTTNFVLGCTAAGWGCFSIWLYYTVYLLVTIRGWSPLLASVSFAQAPVSGLVASLLAGLLMSRIKPHWIMLISMGAFFLGSLLLATAPTHQSYWLNTFFGILIMPFGMDMSNPAATILLSNSVSKEHQGIAASLVVTTVNYSISIALGIAGTVEMQVNSSTGDPLSGFRAAQYFGTGIGFLGVLLALCFLLQSHQSNKSLLPIGSKRGVQRREYTQAEG